jgi:hypothetical protein
VKVEWVTSRGSLARRWQRRARGARDHDSRAPRPAALRGITVHPVVSRWTYAALLRVRASRADCSSTS